MILFARLKLMRYWRNTCPGRKRPGYFFLILYNLNGWALPSGFVYLHDVCPAIQQDIRYASDNNFIGRPIAGYDKPVCILTKLAATRLCQAQEEALTLGYHFKVYDCYRPQMAVNDFYQWSQNPNDTLMSAEYYPRQPKTLLFKRHYIAKSSGHTRGSTMDLTLVRDDIMPNAHPTKDCYNASGKSRDDNSIDMGTRFDCLDKSANLKFNALSKEEMKNRTYLKGLMIKHGFKPYAYEWWHFTLANEPYPKTYFNFRVA